MRRLILPGTALLVGLTVGGCATLGERAAGESAEERVRAEEPVVVVENRSSRNLRVFALIDGTQFRLGTVGSARTRSFSLPASLPWGKEFRLVASPSAPGSARGGLRSEPVSLRAGHEVNWRLEDRPGVLHAPFGELTVFRTRAEVQEEGES